MEVSRPMLPMFDRLKKRSKMLKPPAKGMRTLSMFDCPDLFDDDELTMINLEMIDFGRLEGLE